MLPTILIFDSGLGGLTVHSEIARVRPDAQFVYVIDDALFPYGRLASDALVSRVVATMDHLIPRIEPDLVVIACNTASTLVMPALRARFAMPFVGTVPAIKSAAKLTKTNVFSVLATPGTVRRDYTHDLIIQFAASSRVTLVGSEDLARLGETHMCGNAVADADILAEIAPAFVDHDGKRTDTIVLACTHYPLLLERFRALAPWPVNWIDPAPAIARRVVQLIGGRDLQAPTPDGVAIFTGRYPEASLRAALESRRFHKIETAAIA
jgi:glutamate racemase